MYEAKYFKSDGSGGPDFSLPVALFDGVVNTVVLHQVITAYLANQRQGTAQKKNRAAVAGGSSKPWRQKGTGRARQGTIRAAQWRGGGRAFPPQAHSWNQKVPKQVRALARRSAFNDRAQAGRVWVIQSFDIDEPKTRQLTRLLGKLDATGKVLLLTNGTNKALYLSGRNLEGVRVLPFGSESPFDVVWSGTVVIEESALTEVGPAKAKKPKLRRRPLDRKKTAKAEGTKKANTKKASTKATAKAKKVTTTVSNKKSAAKAKSAKKPVAKATPKKAAAKKATAKNSAKTAPKSPKADAPKEPKEETD